MKKTSLILNIVLIVAVAALYVLHFTGNTNSKPAKGDASEIAASPLGGIVYLDIDSVLNNYDMYADISAELEAKLKTKDAELKSKQRTFERSVTDFQNKISKGLVTRTEAAEIEQNLQVEQQSLMQLQQQMQYELAEEEQVSQRRVLNSIMEYLKTLENESDYQFVLGNSFGGNILYANSDLNITKAVTAGLNEEYQATKE